MSAKKPEKKPTVKKPEAPKAETAEDIHKDAKFAGIITGDHVHRLRKAAKNK